MRPTTLSREAASALAVRILGLDSATVDLLDAEGVAASLRRAASFMCPTSPGRLVGAVLSSIQPLAAGEIHRDDVADVLQRIVASGDLLELPRDTGRLLYLAPPSYIECEPSRYLLLGIRPHGVPLIELGTADAIDYEGHTRLLSLSSADGPTLLQQLGLRPIRKETWVSSPAVEPSMSLIDRYKVRLDFGRKVGQLDRLTILDHAAPISYYRGRWRAPTPADSGDFITRRPQAYGSDLWCLTRFRAGVPQQLIGLPMDNPLIPGRDEAWRYQAAVDEVHGMPQRVRISPCISPPTEVKFDFFSPLPGFAERYLQLAGLALGKTQGALFSFRLPVAARSDVAAFLTDMLWMTQEEA